MKVHATTRGGVIVLQPQERLTVETKDDFYAALTASLAEGRANLVLDLAHVDRAIVFKVNGAAVGRFELDDKAPAVDTHEVDVRVGVRGGTIDLRELNVYRDVYYLSSISGVTHVQFPYRVPDGQYFFLGDNSSNSTDSRAWETVPAGHLVGRAFMVFWPAVPGDFAVRRIR